MTPPLANMPRVLSEVADALTAAGDRRAAATAAAGAALTHFVEGRAGAGHAARLSVRLADPMTLFDLCEAAIAASRRGLEPEAAYRVTALRLLDIEAAVLRQGERRSGARRNGPREWIRR